MRALALAAVVCSACDALVHVDALDIHDAAPGGSGGDAPISTGPRIVFVTAATYGADLTSGVLPDPIAGAADLCQAEARLAGLTHVYFAWLSTTDPLTSPANKMSQLGGPFVLANAAQTIVAKSWTDLVGGQLLHAISADATGLTVNGKGCDVWTNTSALGTPADSAVTDDCYEWTSVDQGVDVIAGSVLDTDNRWTANVCNLSCANATAARLYCIEQ